MKRFRVRYTVKAVGGVVETIVTADTSLTAQKLIANQNGGRDKVTFYSANEVR